MTAISDIRSRLIPIEEVPELKQSCRNRGKSIVFTNGCFDILHKGHISYLAEASELGDFFVVGLNTDRSVQLLKGEGRPLQDEDSRAMVLASLQFVDAVVLFDEETPYELIKSLVPDVLVKGSDYPVKDIVGYDIVTGNGGKVVTVEFLPGYSTSAIVRKIKKY